MAKRKRTAKGRAAEPKAAVSLPKVSDMGATGPAMVRRLMVVTVKDEDPETGRRLGPPIKQARVVDMVERWLKRWLDGKTEGGDWLTTAQANTALRLRDAWEPTERAPGTDYARPRVDSSPKPDHAIAIQIDRVSRWHRLAKHIPAEDLPILEHCAIRGIGPASLKIGGRKPYAGPGWALGMDHLRAALDRLSVVV